LRESLAVAQVDEDHAAVVAGGIDPANQGDGFPDVGGAEFVAVVGAHGCGLGKGPKRRWTGKCGRTSGEERAVRLVESIRKPFRKAKDVAGFLGARGENFELQLGEIGSDHQGESGSAALGVLELLVDLRRGEWQVAGNSG